MKIEKRNLKNGGCAFCDRVEYDYSNEDVKVSYPYDYVYELEMGNHIHKLCEDCLIDLYKTIDVELK